MTQSSPKSPHLGMHEDLWRHLDVKQDTWELWATPEQRGQTQLSQCFWELRPSFDHMGSTCRPEPGYPDPTCHSPACSKPETCAGHVCFQLSPGKQEEVGGWRAREAFWFLGPGVLVGSLQSMQ